MTTFVDYKFIHDSTQIAVRDQSHPPFAHNNTRMDTSRGERASRNTGQSSELLRTAFAQGAYRYDGAMKTKVPHGVGRLYLGDELVYHGEFVQGEMHGQGYRRFLDGREFVGHFVEGEPDGIGILTYPDGKVEEGTFEGGLLQGTMCHRQSKETHLAGGFKQGKRYSFHMILNCQHLMIPPTPSVCC
eukprot:m.248262 g.248262  ORF g.248262 m.248262 type:complete len:187 (+) comp15411_c0_seq4:35-595(+)